MLDGHTKLSVGAKRTSRIQLSWPPTHVQKEPFLGSALSAVGPIGPVLCRAVAPSTAGLLREVFDSDGTAWPFGAGDDDYSDIRELGGSACCEEDPKHVIDAAANI